MLINNIINKNVSADNNVMTIDNNSDSYCVIRENNEFVSSAKSVESAAETRKLLQLKDELERKERADEKKNQRSQVSGFIVFIYVTDFCLCGYMKFMIAKILSMFLF